jgi:hypothetical protein
MILWDSSAACVKVLQPQQFAAINSSPYETSIFSDCPIDDSENEVQRHGPLRILTNSGVRGRGQKDFIW